MSEAFPIGRLAAVTGLPVRTIRLDSDVGCCPLSRVAGAERRAGGGAPAAPGAATAVAAMAGGAAELMGRRDGPGVPA